MSSAEWRLLSAARHWAQSRHRTLQWDTRLNSAARVLLAQAPQNPGDPLSLEPLRQEALRLGCTDGQIAAVALRLPGGGDVVPAMVAALKAQLSHVEANTIGVALQAWGDDTRAVVALSHRLVRLSPVPAFAAPGATLTLHGHVLQGDHRTTVGLALTYPDGSTRRLEPQQHDGVFSGAVAVGALSGELNVQVLVEKSRGPEVAAQFPVAVGSQKSAWAEPIAASLKPTLPSHKGDGEQNLGGPAATALAELVWGVRDAHGLSLPPIHPLLNAAAAQHSFDMRQKHYFAHVSPRGSSPAERVGESGLQVSRLLENIADAPSPDEALGQWMASPAHRANLLDGQVTAMGLSVTPGDRPDTLLAVLVLAKLLQQGSDQELAQAALQRLDDVRRRRGQQPWVRDAALQAVASSRSRANAMQKRLGSGVDLTRALLQQPFVERAAVDFYLADSVDIVATSAHLAEDFQRVGVGVFHNAARSAGALQPRLWLTVVYTQMQSEP